MESFTKPFNGDEGKQLKGVSSMELAVMLKELLIHIFI
jgi:hypothetical protein